MADALVQLNTNWRVADDPPQWTIEQRIGNPSARDSGWCAPRTEGYYAADNAAIDGTIIPSRDGRWCAPGRSGYFVVDGRNPWPVARTLEHSWAGRKEGWPRRPPEYAFKQVVRRQDGR